MSANAATVGSARMENAARMAAVTHAFGGLMLQSWQFSRLLFGDAPWYRPLQHRSCGGSLGGLGKEAGFHFALAVYSCYLRPRFEASKRTYMGFP